MFRSASAFPLVIENVFRGGGDWQQRPLAVFMWTYLASGVGESEHAMRRK